jgi:hypothetical protein
LHQDRISSVLRSAEVLQVKGLSEGPRSIEVSDQLTPEPQWPTSTPPTTSKPQPLPQQPMPSPVHRGGSMGSIKRKAETSSQPDQRRERRQSSHETQPSPSSSRDAFGFFGSAFRGTFARPTSRVTGFSDADVTRSALQPPESSASPRDEFEAAMTHRDADTSVRQMARRSGRCDGRSRAASPAPTPASASKPSPAAGQAYESASVMAGEGCFQLDQLKVSSGGTGGKPEEHDDRRGDLDYRSLVQALKSGRPVDSPSGSG